MARGAGAEIVTDAILLRSVATGESDRIVTLLTRAYGKVVVRPPTVSVTLCERFGVSSSGNASSDSNTLGGVLSALLVGCGWNPLCSAPSETMDKPLATARDAFAAKM